MDHSVDFVKNYGKVSSCQSVFPRDGLLVSIVSRPISKIFPTAGRSSSPARSAGHP